MTTFRIQNVPLLDDLSRSDRCSASNIVCSVVYRCKILYMLYGTGCQLRAYSC